MILDNLYSFATTKHASDNSCLESNHSKRVLSSALLMCLGAKGQRSWMPISAMLKKSLDVNKTKEVDAVERQWLEHLCSHEKMFETWIVRDNEC